MQMQMQMSMRTGSKGGELIQEFEGYHTALPDGGCEAYLDTLVKPSLRSPGYKGLWTIGCGLTGPDITKGTRWSKKYHTQRFFEMLERHENVVKNLIKVKLNQNQFDALVSLSFNLGLHNAPTLVKLVNEEKWDEAVKAFALYNKAGGKVVKGLVRRRQAEAKLFDTYTKEEIVENSTTIGTLRRIKNWLVGLPAAFFGFEWLSGLMDTGKEMFEWVRNFTDNHKILMGALAIGLFIGVCKYVESKKVKEAQEGNYTPSGDAA